MTDSLTAIWSRYASDPLLFCRTFWPDVTLTAYQAEILRSVVENTETWVHSANKMGKSFTAALCALWWFSTRKAKVITSSTTEHQLATVLWSEIEGLLRRATLPDGGRPFPFVQARLQLFLPPEPGETKSEKKYYLIGQVTQRVESFQGHHLKPLADGTGTVLFIFEEASGLEEEFYEAATSQAHRILVIGNPLRAQGVFYEKCRAGDKRREVGQAFQPDTHQAGKPDLPGLFRKVIHISGDDSPNVVVGRKWTESGRTGPPPTPLPGILSWSEYNNRLSNWRPHKARTRLFGLFDDESGCRLFPYSSLAAAQKLHTLYQARIREQGFRIQREARMRNLCLLPGGPFALGVDCAQGGDDCSAWVVFGRFGVVEVLVEPTRNTRRIVGNTLDLMRTYGIDGDAVAFDSAIGRAVADELREQGYAVRDVAFGARAFRKDDFHCRRAELYGELAEAMQSEVGNQNAEIGIPASDLRPPTSDFPLDRIGRLLAGDEAAWKCYWRGPDAPDPFEHRPPTGAEQQLLEEQKHMERASWCVSIPSDESELREDLAVLPVRHDGQGRLYLPPKDGDRAHGGEDSLRKLLGGRSPDRGDAFLRLRIRGQEPDGPLVW